jgi:hypothetical protein
MSPSKIVKSFVRGALRLGNTCFLPGGIELSQEFTAAYEKEPIPSQETVNAFLVALQLVQWSTEVA